MFVYCPGVAMREVANVQVSLRSRSPFAFVSPPAKLALKSSAAFAGEPLLSRTATPESGTLPVGHDVSEGDGAADRHKRPWTSVVVRAVGQLDDIDRRNATEVIVRAGSADWQSVVWGWRTCCGRHVDILAGRSYPAGCEGERLARLKKAVCIAIPTRKRRQEVVAGVAGGSIVIRDCDPR